MSFEKEDASVIIFEKKILKLGGVSECRYQGIFIALGVFLSAYR